MTEFKCIHCGFFPLVRRTDEFCCVNCNYTYPIVRDVPVLLPPINEIEKIINSEGLNVSLDDLQRLYDRVYQQDGLMGTDLDEAYDRETKQILINFAEYHPGICLLDIGTGTGNLWKYIPENVDGFAIDLSITGVHKARSRYPGLTVSVSLAEYLPYSDDFFESVIAADTIEHTLSPSLSLQEVWRVLKPYGILSASFPIPNSLRKWGWNRLVRNKLQMRFVLRLLEILVRRTLLFGRPDFQLIDRDYDIVEWKSLLVHSGFEVMTVSTWPNPPSIPIVYLVKAVKILGVR